MLTSFSEAYQLDMSTQLRRLQKELEAARRERALDGREQHPGEGSRSLEDLEVAFRERFAEEFPEAAGPPIFPNADLPTGVEHAAAEAPSENWLERTENGIGSIQSPFSTLKKISHLSGDHDSPVAIDEMMGPVGRLGDVASALNGIFYGGADQVGGFVAENVTNPRLDRDDRQGRTVGGMEGDCCRRGRGLCLRWRNKRGRRVINQCHAQSGRL